MSALVEILAFNDPMMGLAWEMEPVWRQLREWYGDRVALRQVERRGRGASGRERISAME